MDLKPDPVKILDLAEIVRSPTEKDLGPWFYVDARKTPIFIEVRYLIHLLYLESRLEIATGSFLLPGKRTLNKFSLMIETAHSRLQQLLFCTTHFRLKG